MKKITFFISILIFTASGHAGVAHTLMKEKNINEQKSILSMLISSTGNQCKQVARFAYLGEQSHADYWTVDCKDEDFIVSIEGRGDMKSKVLSCDTAHLLSIKCWKPF